MKKLKPIVYITALNVLIGTLCLILGVLYVERSRFYILEVPIILILSIVPYLFYQRKCDVNFLADIGDYAKNSVEPTKGTGAVIFSYFPASFFLLIWIYMLWRIIKFHMH